MSLATAFSPLRTGRKEIVMFFWLYAVIELLAIFMDSGIIPTANVSYPVSISKVNLGTMFLTRISGSLLCIPVLSHQRTVAFSSTASSVSNSQKMVHRYHYGCVPLVN
jgi:hypothetical protein